MDGLPLKGFLLVEQSVRSPPLEDVLGDQCKDAPGCFELDLPRFINRTSVTL